MQSGLFVDRPYLTTAAAAARVSAASKSAAVLAAAVMAGSAGVALPVARLVGLEVGKRLVPAVRHGSSVAVVRVIAIVDMAIETVAAVEPRSSTDEHAAGKPIRPIIPIRRAIIRRIVEITIRAFRRNSNPDDNL